MPQDNDKQEIMELYKLAVDMADRISHRRGVMNHFYVTLSTAVFTGLLALSIKGIHSPILFFVLAFGILICVVWCGNIKSYRKLNEAKFEVILQIEKQLPLRIFANEQEFYKKNKRKDFSDVEKLIPFVFGLLELSAIIFLAFANMW